MISISFRHQAPESLGCKVERLANQVSSKHVQGWQPPPEDWRLMEQVARRFFVRRAPWDGSSIDDLVQETLFRAWARFARMAPGPSCPSAYVRRIAERIVLDVARRGRPLRRVQSVGGLRELANIADQPRRAVPTTQAVGVSESEAEARARLEAQLLALGMAPADAAFFLLSKWDARNLGDVRLRLGLTERQAEAARRRILRFLSAPGRIERLMMQWGCSSPQSPAPTPQPPDDPSRLS